MKKVLCIILLLLTFSLTGCTESDATKFKKDYESLNGATNASGIMYRPLDISSDNPIVYSSFEEVSKKINNKEDFLVYVGFSACPWCRSVIESVLDVAKEKNIDKIYYINVRSDNTKGTDLRGYYKLDDNGKAVVDIKADPYYYEVLKTLDNFLTPYTLDNNGIKVETGENRLYAPSFIVYKSGVAKNLSECISNLQTDAYMTLSNEMINDTKNMISNIFDEYLKR